MSSRIVLLWIEEIDERKTQNFSLACGTQHTSDMCWCTCARNSTTTKFGYQPNIS